MAIYRNVKTSFWEDEKVIDEFSAEDRYFFLYLLTNPQATQLGIYKLVPRTTAFYLGYSKEVVMVLLDRFETKYHMIKYSNETSEIAIKNFLRHSIIKGGKPVMDCLKKEERAVKNKELVQFIIDSISDKDDVNGTVKEFIDYLVSEKGFRAEKERNKEKDKEKEKEKDKDKDKEKENNVDVTCHVTSNVTSNDTLSDDDIFEMMWALYPKKRGKTAVSKKSKKAIRKVGYEHMCRAIERYKKEIVGKDEQYIMMGSTFFNGRYQDYLDENYEPPKTYSERMAQPFLDFLNKGTGASLNPLGGSYD